jgi:UDP-GlcNAc:undecaprenyl-phosphate/decaprenyl-phosphate GlcNAc-1-phosphate transferase
MTPLSLNLLAVAVAAAVSFTVAGLVRRAALRRGIVVAPRPDRWHQVPTPTFGGVGVFAGVIAGATLAGGLSAPAWPVLLAGGALFVIGWFDDLMPMSALAKMVSSLAVAGFFVLTLVTTRLTTPMHAALTVAAILWFGGLDNAINLLDNMDGLAAGVTTIAAVGLALTFTAELGPAIVTVLLTLAAALVGFLVWNRHPARMFMGNCGSLAIGGVIAASATIAIARAGTLRDAAAALLILIVPVFDSSFVILLRRLAGRSTTRGNIDHTSHRLVSAGFSDRTAVWLLYGLGIVGAAAGGFVHTHPGTGAPFAAAVLVGTLMIGLWLARVPAYAGQDFQAFQNAPFAPLITDLTFRWHAGEVLLDVVLISSCYYAAYRIRFEGDPNMPIFLATFSKSLPAILGTQLAALYASGLYKRLWRTFGLHDLATVMRAVGSGVILSVLVAAYLFKFQAFSRSVFLIYAVLLTAAIVATRSSFRVFGRMAKRTGARTRVAIYGAGARGQLLARELLASDESDRMPVAFIDDDESKLSRRVVGVAVRGTIRDLEMLLAKYRIEELVISTPAIGSEAEARVRAACAAKGVPVARLFYEIR